MSPLVFSHKNEKIGILGRVQNNLQLGWICSVYRYGSLAIKCYRCILYGYSNYFAVAAAAAVVADFAVEYVVVDSAAAAAVVFFRGFAKVVIRNNNNSCNNS